eukprot:1351840-Pleurochrysis_carterae.AAC.1
MSPRNAAAVAARLRGAARRRVASYTARSSSHRRGRARRPPRRLRQRISLGCVLNIVVGWTCTCGTAFRKLLTVTNGWRTPAAISCQCCRPAVDIYPVRTALLPIHAARCRPTGFKTCTGDPE